MPTYGDFLATTTAQEQFQKAYVHAVVTGAGCISARPEPDMDGIDLTIRQTVTAEEAYFSALDVQLKSTTQDVVDDLYVSQKLTKSHYDTLRSTKISYPRILVVMTVPPDRSDWVNQSEVRLQMMRCAYWVSLAGADPISKGSKVVKVPRANIFAVDALCELMYRVRASLEITA